MLSSTRRQRGSPCGWSYLGERGGWSPSLNLAGDCLCVNGYRSMNFTGAHLASCNTLWFRYKMFFYETFWVMCTREESPYMSLFVLRWLDPFQSAGQSCFIWSWTLYSVYRGGWLCSCNKNAQNPKDMAFLGFDSCLQHFDLTVSPRLRPPEVIRVAWYTTFGTFMHEMSVGSCRKHV